MKCTQTKCAFHTSHGMEIMCPECSECKSPSNELDDNCTNCWNCLRDEGFVRQGFPKFIKDAVKQKIQEKELEVEVDD